MKFQKLWMVFILMLLLIVTACSSKENTTNSPSESKESSNEPAAATESVENRTLTIAIGADLVTFDIHDHNTTTTEAVHRNMFNYLVINEGASFSGDLAESWELADDQVTWKFKLKEGVTFHNGDPLTAEDVKFTLERVATNESLRSHNDYKAIKQVNVINDYEFEIVTHEPTPVLLNRISRQASGILPKNYIETHGWDHFIENPVGTGPFKYVEWRRDDRVVLEAYENYFEGRVKDWDRVVFRAITEDSTRVAELLTGGVDIAQNIAPNEWDRIDNNPGTSVVSAPTNRTMLLFLRNTEGYPTSDVRVRLALDYAIDNKVLADALLRGGATPSLTRVNPGNFGAHEGLYGQYRYDPAKAKELLREAGYPNGFTMTIHSPSGRYLMDRETLEMSAAMLAEVGVKVEMNFMEWGSFVDIRRAENHKDGYLIGLGSSLFDSAQSLEYFSSVRAKGQTDYFNPEVEQLIADAAVNMNPVSRLEQYKRVQEIVAEEVPILTLFQVDGFFGINDRINFKPRLDEVFWIPSITLN